MVKSRIVKLSFAFVSRGTRKKQAALQTLFERPQIGSLASGAGGGRIPRNSARGKASQSLKKLSSSQTMHFLPPFRLNVLAQEKIKLMELDGPYNKPCFDESISHCEPPRNLASVSALLVPLM
jgi:hypothetical protein